MNCKLPLSIRFKRSLNVFKYYFSKPTGIYVKKKLIRKWYLSYFVKRTVKISIGQVKANNSFSIKRLTCITKDGHPIYFKILSYQNQINDIITLKLLNITEQVETEKSIKSNHQGTR